MLTVTEIFRSIQGESTYAGAPCVFVRLTGCDLRCAWCDTAYAFTEGSKMSLEEVLAAVDELGCPLVEITGGEPLLQEDVYPLMTALLLRGKTVLLETGGHVSIERVPQHVVKVIDVKCPASGEALKVCWSNLDRLGPDDEVKFVVQDRTDYEFAREVVLRYQLGQRCAAVLMSPVHGVMPARQLAEWVLADRLPVRMQLQVHKFIWEPDTRGV